MNRLSGFWEDVGAFFSGAPSADDQREIAKIVIEFPRIFDKAVEDWTRYKLGVKSGLFTAAQRDQVITWYRDFPKLWDTIRPNFVMTRTPQGTYLPVGETDFARKVDLFVSRLGQQSRESGLSVAPIIVAGIVIAGAVGVAGALWAVSYLKQQANVSRIIDEVTAGRLPATVLQSAIEADALSFTPFEGVSSALKWVALGLLAYFAVPVIGEFLRGRKK